MAAVIVARDLYKCYAGFAPVLRGVNIDVEAGELAAIMGPSGCGKSTMLHILGMLHAPDTGSLEILGTNVLALTSDQTAAFRRGNMGFVMQSSNLFEHSTVFENVEFPLIYENVPPQERWERVIRALELVRLSARVHYRSNRLSGGEQQRVAIARAMVNNPRILLADEPTGALDARTSKLIMENFRSLCHSGGVSMVMVTHDPGMAEYCDSIYTLEDGILHCRKRNLAALHGEARQNLLSPPEAIVHGALVAEKFPEPSGQCVMEMAHRLHALGLLSRIYTLEGSGLLGSPQGYALPLAVRRIGAMHFFAAFRALFLHVKANSRTFWPLWKTLPANAAGKGIFGKLWAFASGALLTRWGIEDHITLFYASGTGLQTLASWIASRALGTPFAFSVHTRDLAHTGNALDIMARDAVFVCCDTQATREALQARLSSLPAEKIVLLRDPLTLSPPDDDIDLPLVPNTTTGEQPLTLLAAGTLTARKGYDLLLRACARLRATGRTFTLAIIGNGPARTRLRWLSWRLGLRKCVRFLGQIPHENMTDYFSKADIFLAPGRQMAGDGDGFPSALAEAMAFGLAVIVSDLPGQSEAVVNGESGLVVPQNDLDALTGALEGLADDPQKRQALGAAARLRIHALLDESATEARLKHLFLAAVHDS